MSKSIRSFPPFSAFDWFVFASLALLLAFGLPLYQLGLFALQGGLYSHVILIPFVSCYLVWLQQSRLASDGARLSPAWAMACFLAGLVLLSIRLMNSAFAAPSAHQDSLAILIYALILLFSGICCLRFTRATMRVMAFPLGLLVFMAPFPVVVEEGLETFLQHGSAYVAHEMFQLIGTPVYREGTDFILPAGFRMQVAPECSGIHSTLALFITSLIAGQLLLRSPWSRTLLALSVLPIALLRNGFRVTTIGELCVRISPDMIHHYIHRQGGPIFFVISLIPFSLVLILLLKLDGRKSSSSKASP